MLNNALVQNDMYTATSPLADTQPQGHNKP